MHQTKLDFFYFWKYQNTSHLKNIKTMQSLYGQDMIYYSWCRQNGDQSCIIISHLILSLSISFLSSFDRLYLYINILIRIKILHQNYNEICTIKFISLFSCLFINLQKHCFERKDIESYDCKIICWICFYCFVNSRYTSVIIILNQPLYRANFEHNDISPYLQKDVSCNIKKINPKYIWNL